MTLNEHLTQALHQARKENAALLNQMRAISVAAFAITAAAMTFGGGDESWRPMMNGLAIYTVLALVLMVHQRQSSGIHSLSRFGVPFIDIPMVTWIQWTFQSTIENPGNVSEFSISIFVVLLMLSALTLSSSQIYVSLALAIVAEQFLQHNAGIDAGGRVMSTLVLLTATWICIYAGAKRIQLVGNVAHIDARRKRLQRYFSPGIGELLEQHAGGGLEEGKDCELTIVFADIRGFTAMCEELDSRQTVSLLNTIHARMVEALFRHAGTLDKYTGDGLLAYFNAPVGQSDHAVRAVRCAQEMQRQLEELDSTILPETHAPIRMGFGIHTGQAIVGDIGAPHRREYTAIGDSVNVASRIEQLTKDVGIDILISETTAALIKDQILLNDVGEFEIRGRTLPMRLLTPQFDEIPSDQTSSSAAKKP